MEKRKDEPTYDPKKATFVICVGVIVMIILNMVYDYNHYTETWLVCNNEQHKYANYKEIVKYRYKDDKMYGFYREEIISAENQEVLDNIYNTFKETRDSLDLTDDLSYELEIDGLNLNVKTYIGVEHISYFFDNYIQSTPLDHKSDIKTVEEYYNGEGYECKISYK